MSQAQERAAHVQALCVSQGQERAAQVQELCMSQAQERAAQVGALSMNASRRVSPAARGYHFDTASRKKAVGNIFESTDQESLQRLFRNSGDKRAEERAKIIFSIDQDMEERTRALMALKQRRKDKLLQFLKLRKYSIKVH